MTVPVDSDGKPILDVPWKFFDPTPGDTPGSGKDAGRPAGRP